MTDVSLQLERLLEIGRLDDADRLLSRAIAEAPDDPDNLFYTARIAEERGNFAEAREVVCQLLREQPQHLAGRLLRYDVLSELKEFVEAEEAILELLHEHPEVGHFYAKYAWLMLRTLHLEKGRALTEEALRLDPDDALARVLSLLISLVDGRGDVARGQLTELVADDPDALHVSWTMVMVLSSEHRHAEALAICREILRANPDDPDVIDAMVELRAASHWLMLPIWPMVRFGWLGAGVLWGGFAVITLIARQTGNLALGALLGAIWLAYAIYSWTCPPLLKKRLRERGF